MSRISEIVLHRLRVPLAATYKLSFAALNELEAFVVEAVGEDGRRGLGEATVQTGYTPEDVDSGWAFLNAAAARAARQGSDEAVAEVLEFGRGTPVAASALATALALVDAPLPSAAVRVPLLAPVHSENEKALADEIETLLARGFRTLKVKVGFDAAADERRLRRVQRAAGGRATLRIDANGGYALRDALRFAASLDPVGIELLEQPCAADDWDGNAAVAAASPVPVMLDESIYGLAEIGRAARIAGVGFVKLKLKKIGTPARLETALRRIRDLGLEPVLGDGTGTDIAAWQEAVVASRTITNAGEMNGFMKTVSPLLVDTVEFKDGELVVPEGLRPQLNQSALARYRVGSARLTPAKQYVL